MIPERIGFLSGEVDTLIESVTPEYEAELTIFLLKQVLFTNEVPKNILGGNTNLALSHQSLQESSNTSQCERGIQSLLAVKDRLRKFVCSQCGYVTRQRSGYLNHVKQCDFSQILQCKHCDFKAKSKSGLYIHTNGCHSLCRYKCDLCDFTTKWKTSLQPHFCKLHATEKLSFTTERCGGTVQSLRKFVCSPCGYATDLKRSYSDHIKHCDLLKIFQCKYCKFKCRSKTGLYVHINGRHGLKHYRCKLCNFITSWKSSIQQHFIRRHGTKKTVFDVIKGVGAEFKRSVIKPNIQTSFQCAQCDYSTKSKYHLRTHINSSHNSRQYECEQCPFSTKWKSSMGQHIYSRHGASAVMRVTSGIDNNSNQRYHCAHCNFKTMSKTSLYVHVNGCHGWNYYGCAQCNFTTKWKGSLKVHLRKAHGTKKDSHKLLKCERCDFKFVSSSALSNHINKYHSLKKHACNHCKFTTNWKSSLKEHVRRKHSTVKSSFTNEVAEQNSDTNYTVVNKTEFQCAHCEYKTKLKPCLISHVNGRHGICRYKCELCTFATRWEHGLQGHTQRVHSGKKVCGTKYKCKNCSYVTNWRSNLVKHINGKHKKNKLFCKRCCFVTTWMQTFVAHKQTCSK